MDTNETPLNLDELFGQGRPVKVLWDGREYNLLRPEAFGARETLHLNSLRRNIYELQQREDDKPETGTELERLLDEALTMLCTDFPVASVPFPGKLHTLAFYTVETQKKAMKAALQQIGAPPSAG